MPRCGIFYMQRPVRREDPDHNHRMVLILPEHSQRPYRYGMTLLCIGAMFNWLGLADNNAEPVRYIGVTLIAAGAMLICLAMCFWMKATHDPQVAALQAEQDSIHHVVTIHRSDSVLEKPPDYDTVTGASPPSYEDAIKLSPSQLLDSTDGDQAALKLSETARQSTSQPDTSTAPTESSTHAQVHSKPETAGDDSAATDNFGSRVLRISRKFLRRSRSGQEVDGDAGQTNSALDVNVTPDVAVR